MTKDFESLNINSLLIKALKLQNINEPTEIQKETIPLILQKKDVIGQSETGSGKTLAYLLPVISNINLDEKHLQVIVLTPTHELALQVSKQIDMLIKNSELPLRTAVIIGSANISRQIDKLKQKPHIIVGSVGRILELISKKKLSGHTVKTIIIDEADKMLDKNNIENVKALIKTTLKDRQVIMFSASMTSSIKIAESITNDVTTIKINDKQILPNTINHMYFITEKRDKVELLRKIIRSENPKKVLVFVNEPNTIETIVEKLEYHKLKATAMYGLADKLERKKSMEDFKLGKVQILVTSDLGSRGLNIENITHIINLDIPEEPNFYLHRAGRTGRAGKVGSSISIITNYEEKLIKKYEKVLNIKITKKQLNYGKIQSI